MPLITSLLKPEVYQSDPLGMGETRDRAATLLSKVFLHYLVLISEVEADKVFPGPVAQNHHYHGLAGQ